MTVTKIIDREALEYRPCVGLILFNNNNKIFVGERIDHKGAWQMPQGGIDEGETVTQAALRELKEEVGTDKAEIIRISEQTLKYDLPDHLIRSLWNGRYRGQEQTWVALKFMGEDSDINIITHDPPEFSAWQWVNLRETPDLIVPFKRDLYREVITLFSDLIS